MAANQAIGGVVFDLDGTLITSEALNRKSRQVVCERHGIDISEFDMRRLRGVPVEQSIDLLCQESGCELDSSLRQSLIYAKRQYIDEHLGEIPLEPHVEEVWTRLADACILLGIATSASSAFARSILERDGFFRQSLSSLITVDDVVHPKPDTEALDRAAADLQLMPDQLLYVGDTATDQQAALSAGRHFVGYTRTHDLGEEDMFAPDCPTISTLQELVAYLGV